MTPLNYTHLRLDDDIELRLIPLEDAATLFDCVEKNRTYLRQWMDWVDLTKTINDSRTFVRLSICAFMQGGSFIFGIYHRNTLIGTIGLTQQIKEANLGYWIAKDYQGKGIVSTCAQKMTEIALTELNVGRVRIRCATDNHKSRAIPERLGFTHEGIARGADLLHGKRIDLHIYSYLESDLPLKPQRKSGF